MEKCLLCGKPIEIKTVKDPLIGKWIGASVCSHCNHLYTESRYFGTKKEAHDKAETMLRAMLETMNYDASKLIRRLWG